MAKKMTTEFKMSHEYIVPNTFYRTSFYYFIYPSTIIEEAVHRNASEWRRLYSDATSAAKNYTKLFGDTVRVADSTKLIFVIKEEQFYEKRCLFCLFSNCSGWVIYQNWPSFERVFK